MNFKIFSCTIISTMLLVTKEVYSGKKYETPDLTPIGTRFADLLNSLVKVNLERVDALKKLLYLYDIDGSKRLLRTQDSPLEDSNIEEVIVFHNRQNDKYPEIRNPYLDWIPKNKRLCLCEDRDSDNDVFNDDVVEQAESQGDPNNDAIIIFNDDSSAHQSFLPLDKQFSNERYYPTYDSTSSQELLSKPLETGLVRKSRPCISPRRGYKDCKLACKEAFGRSCADYGCKVTLYHNLRKECKKRCKIRFKEPYENDYDDY